MKRREMIKSATALATTQFFFSRAIASTRQDLNIRDETSQIKRFGDDRDWFF